MLKMPIPSAEEMRQDAAKRAELQEIADMTVQVMLTDITIGGQAATARARLIVAARNNVLQGRQQLPPAGFARVGEGYPNATAMHASQTPPSEV